MNPIVATKGFSKTFSGRTVLNAVDLDIYPGEVHGLIGQNGSGKSTLIKILSGYHAPDPGARLSVDGADVPLPLNPGEPARLGISFVHQDLGLFEEGTILENLRVGRYETSFGWRISWRHEREQTRQALARFGLTLDPDTKISDLSQVDRALVAIVRAIEQVRLSSGQGVLILDEPTSYLPRDGVDRLFTAVRDVAGMGVGVLFVTHRLEEILAVTDRVSILRDGYLIETIPNTGLTEDQLITSMLGYSLENYYPEAKEADGDIIFSAKEVSGSYVKGFSLDVRRGEIVGLTGLLGMGQADVLYLLFGADRANAGAVQIGGQTHQLSQFTPTKARQAGLALLPANRLRDGGVRLATAAENISLPTVRRFYKRGLLRKRLETATMRELMHRFEVNPPEPTQPFGTFSGGNQQKALIAKWLTTNPKTLLLHEPTQGVDVGARRQIFAQLRQAADEGIGTIIASTEYEDLAGLCDRVFVFRNGSVVAQLSGASLTLDRILEQCYRDERTTANAAV